jgi:hypothetical protein
MRRTVPDTPRITIESVTISGLTRVAHVAEKRPVRDPGGGDELVFRPDEVVLRQHLWPGRTRTQCLD